MRSLEFHLMAAGLWPGGKGPPPGWHWGKPRREEQERWHAALPQSPRGFWINGLAVVLRSRSTKGPIAGGVGTGMWAAQLHAHRDNRGLQSREALVSSEIVRHKAGILGPGARRRPGEVPAGTQGQRGPGVQAQACHCGPVTAPPLSGPPFPSPVYDIFQIKDKAERGCQALGSRTVLQPPRPQALHLTFEPPFRPLQNGEASSAS